MRIYATFLEACTRIEDDFKHRSHTLRTEKWQGIETKLEHAMRELMFTYFSIPLQGLESLDHWRDQIKPNLPFADVHFDERVGGVPTNPGEAWTIWPWGNSAAAHRTDRGLFFTHTYQERFWPKLANEETLERYTEYNDSGTSRWEEVRPRMGIRYEYADLNDLVTNLQAEPFTRQAYLPIWFPEDGKSPGRKPCTLGYHFINRFGYLHVTYYIRSCDYVRHFRDDCYLTIRLLLWILARLRDRDPHWKTVKPGLFNMHIGSFHMFTNDHIKLFPELYRTEQQRRDNA